ncbi:hypothetical protein AN402_4107 [Bacillus wiedmannii]|nr:hypothetical protein AN402_4107 [Bacillus wiedmannii]
MLPDALEQLAKNIEFVKRTSKYQAKANCSVLQGGTRRKSNVIYIVDGIFSFIHKE